jgi:hypothetical protein
MAGRMATPQGPKLGNINNMPNRKYLPSINFSVPFARWSHFYVSIDWTTIRRSKEFFFKSMFLGGNDPVKLELQCGKDVSKATRMSFGPESICEYVDRLEYTECPENGALPMHYSVEEITINVRKMLKKFYWTYLLIWRSLKVALNRSIVSK